MHSLPCAPCIRLCFVALVVISWLLQRSVIAQIATKAAPDNSIRSVSQTPKIYRHRITPHWFANNERFWYRNDLADNKREFIVIDATTGQRRMAFDHSAVAQALGIENHQTQLPIDSLRFFEDSESVGLIGPDKTWLWKPATKQLVEQSLEPETPAINPPKEGFRSTRTGADSEIIFDNQSPEHVEIFWLSGNGAKQSYGKIAAGQRRAQHTFGGHRWLIHNHLGEALGEVVADDTSSTVVLNGRPIPTAKTVGRQTGKRGKASEDARSPDGKWRAAVQNYNIVLQATDGDNGNVLQLTSDGREGLAYGNLTWSPDSKTVVAFRLESVKIPDVYLVQSSPDEGGRAKLQTRPYALPGDPFPRYELNLIHIDPIKHIKPDVDWYEHEWQRPELHWASSGLHFSYQQTDRGHQRFRLIEIELQSGASRNLIDERSDTFIWSAHTENQAFSTLNWLTQSPEIIYVTERSGWRHMVLIDTRNPGNPQDITSGEWIVRGIELIDEDARQIWFRASGVFDQDPYLIHYGRVNFDGSGLTWLTSSNGNHTIQFSPDRRHIIATYSRVDLPPVSELRRVSDGSLVCLLERADTSELEAAHWRAPEVFSAPGRDGRTLIWGIICRPHDFDPSRSYPVIEDIYAGPHGSSVPKTFSISPRYQQLTDSGFIVVKIDGMGTANRSKAFHDVCWQNLKDAGFEDRKAWMRAAAARYPQLDLSRVGIYGTSAGGQNAAAALLFHPDFYKVAVAACGCHDNRLDKASWNEQWMGYPVGPHYGACSNIDNAHKLQGKLLLIVGEMDTNVPPESTLRFANALIRANKDFDMLVIPNGGHGMGGSYGQRKMHDFFVRHLLNATTADH